MVKLDIDIDVDLNDGELIECVENIGGEVKYATERTLQFDLAGYKWWIGEPWHDTPYITCFIHNGAKEDVITLVRDHIEIQLNTEYESFFRTEAINETIEVWRSQKEQERKRAIKERKEKGKREVKIGAFSNTL